MPTTKMVRTTAGLRDVLLDEIDSLRNGETQEGRAHAIARLANAAIASVRLEMDAHDFKARNAEYVPARTTAEVATTVAASIKPLQLAA